MKLVRVERETAALQRALGDWREAVSSRLARVEVLRAARAGGAGSLHAAYRVLDGVSLLQLDDRVVEAAVDVDPTALRSLDAIHLASALSLGDDLGVLVTYDRRMIDAATSAGVETLAPA